MQLAILIFAITATLASLATLFISAPTRRKNSSTNLFIDTSVLIDGRIVDIARSGFLTSKLVIPRSVIGELQLLADKGDTEKRTKARHGLDVIKDLQAIDHVTVEIFADSPDAREGVDQRLISLATQHGGSICTVDFNLNKVAAVQGIMVCNVNELAKNLRLSYLPGETAKLTLTDTGQGDKQAVGHLEDGTMVVVEGASKRIGDTVTVEFIRGIQTDAGRMMFARLEGHQAEKSTKLSKQAKNVVKTAANRVRQGGRRQQSSPNESRTKAEPAKPEQKPAPVAKPKSDKPAKQATTNRNSQNRQPRGSGRSTRPARRTNEDRLVELANSGE